MQGALAGEIPASLRIGYQDVQNAIRKRLHRLAVKDPDGEKSIKLWGAELRAKGWGFLFERVPEDIDGWVFASISPWQQKVCIDSTDLSAGLLTDTSTQQMRCTDRKSVV